jgi:hypothetical protein
MCVALMLNDKEVVLTAVKQTGEALEYAFRICFREVKE